MKQIYICPPWSYNVNYVINPWMEGNFHRVDEQLAVAQWAALHCALEQAGANVTVIEAPPANCPDAVFVANAGLLFQGSFIPSRFKFEERAVEEPFFKEVFSDFTLRDSDLPRSREHLSFEGAGDALYDRRLNTMWMGFGFRTSLGFKSVLETALDESCGDESPMVRPLELVDPRFYHLDTCFCPLDTGQLLWFPEAFSDYSRYVINLWYGELGIPVGEEDALNFACNAVSVGSKLVLPKITSYLREILIERDGLSPLEVDMSQYLRSGGACKCLTLEAVE